MNDFKDKTVYQVYVKSFCDSNGDGIGDIKGVTEKLDYLSGLGVDFLWLNPVFISPQNDGGYDVADYVNIEPMFGTMDDLDELIEKADEKGLGIMLDMVFNHTSTQHEWFQKALAGDPEYQDYYIFKDGDPDTPPTNWVSKFGGNAWEYVPKLGQWYLHLFDKTQADLNWENPKVREELKNVIRFWKKKGVKGFRFDVVNLISKPEVYENDDRGDGRRFYTDGPKIHEYLHELVHDTGIKDMITVGEMSSTTLDNCIGYSNPDNEELSMVFNFHHLKVDYKNGDKWQLQEPDLKQLNDLIRTWQLGMQENNGWNAVFWCNHDQPRVVSRLGDDGKYWKESAKMLATFVHMLRGTPYVYQGEELGMPNAHFDDIDSYRDVESKNYYQILLDEGKTKQEALEILGERSRDNARTPMQWDDGANAGFTTGEPWISVPKIKPEANTIAEAEDPDSITAYYKKLIALRKELPVIAGGTISFPESDDSDLMIYERSDDNDKLYIVNNLTDKEKSVKIPEDFVNAEVLIGNYEDFKPEAEAALRPYEAVVLHKKN